MRFTVRGVVALVLLLAGSGCDTGIPGREASQRRPDSTGPQAPAPSRSTGWTATVYYTAVERFHTGPPTQVVGCLSIDCEHGHAALGSYPKDFVTAVHDEGAGRITPDRYLNWSFDTGYWLDVAARDTAGRPLVPFESAAADADVLKGGTRFTIADCGRQDDGSAVPEKVCAKLRGAHWSVTDEFTPGLGGARHVDLYVGEETGPRFTEGPWYLTLGEATLAIG